VIGCLHVLQMATAVEEDVVSLLLNLKSKLDLAVVTVAIEECGMSEAEHRWGCDDGRDRSLLLAFSRAFFSYSSHSFAVFAGVQGGGRGSLIGDLVLASGDECCGVNVIIDVVDAMLLTYGVYLIENV
jgi:hypothetical protein